MLLSKRELSLAALLLALGSAALWLQWADDASKAPGRAGERRPDYIVEGLSVVTLDAEGLPERRLDALRLRHYPDDDSSELDEPVLKLFDAAALRWRARSVRAWINARGDEILLEQDVRLQRAATAQSAPITLRTSELLVLPEVDYAETARDVEVEREHDRLSATQGLRAWLGGETRIQLFGSVRARVDQPSRPEGQGL